jgi:hypothetical protein
MNPLCFIYTYAFTAADCDSPLKIFFFIRPKKNFLLAHVTNGVVPGHISCRAESGDLFSRLDYGLQKGRITNETSTSKIIVGTCLHPDINTSFP